MTPEVAVVVASHDRPLRLRWLLEALGEQRLPRERFEVVVAHDSRDAETPALLRRHPVVTRALRFAAGSAGPAVKRNAAWRAAGAPLVAFTDDDCRPAADWLERLLAAARAAPGAVVQGATRVDPDELKVKLHAPGARSQEVDPPSPFGQTCNILYPRAVLEAVGGFDERLPVAAGEDTDLLLRARRAGAPLVAAPDAVTYHGVEARWLPARVRGAWRWQHAALVPRRHPSIRRHLPLGLFWKPSHPLVLLAAAGLAAARRRPAALALALPWAWKGLRAYGPGKRAMARAATELPGRALVDLVEVAAMARGSVRYRTVLL